MGILAKPMPGKRKTQMMRQNEKIKDLLIVFLGIIVLVESLLLARIYFPLFRHKPKIPKQTSLAKIAIIIDDNGYSTKDCEALSQIDDPITISVLPHLRYSREVAVCAHDHHKEVMLHLPLEPHRNRDKYPNNYLITTSMPDSLVIQKFNEAIQSVPFAKGLNNHMGSKATEDVELMSVIFTQMKRNNLYFVDSRVTRKTICPYLARKRNLPFAERDVFLDNENDRAYIEQQFLKLKQQAVKNGYAIGIGHARPLTWQIIKEQTEHLSALGYEFVTVKSIIDSL